MGPSLDLDDNTRQALYQQPEEYVADVAEAPAMNAEPQAHHPDSGTAEPANTPEPTAS